MALNCVRQCVCVCMYFLFVPFVVWVLRDSESEVVSWWIYVEHLVK